MSKEKENLGNGKYTCHVSARVVSEAQVINPEPRSQPNTMKPSIFNINSNIEHDEEEDEDEVENEMEGWYDEDGVDGEFIDKLEELRQGLKHPYDGESEARPNLPAFHPSFANVERICEHLFARAAELVENSDFQDAYTQRLLEEIKKHQSIPYESAKRVGKSSLINSILNTPGLAAQGATGSACTCVITEYVSAPQTQSEHFHAEIELFNMKEIEELLAGHLKLYYEYHFDRPDDLTGDELEVSELDAGTALKVFQALFADQEEFRDQDSARTFLRTATKSADKGVLRKLVQWVKDLISLHDGKSGTIHRSADTAEEVAGNIELFVTMNPVLEDENGELLEATPCFWPIVRIVRVSLHSEVLSRGLIIADLPGLSDTNRVRVRITNRYTRKCTFYALVAPVGRVITDNVVHHRLMKVLRRPGGHKMLIVTMIDEMPLHTKPRSLGGTAQAIEAFNRLSDAYNLAYREEKRLEILNRKLRGRERREADQKKARLWFKKKQYEALKHESLVKMRNRTVTNELRQKYQDLTAEGRNLRIVCVSNLHYDYHCFGYNKESLPLSIAATGIPALRLELSAVPAAAKLLVLQRHWRGSLRGTIALMDSYSSQSILHRQGELKKVVQKSYEASVVIARKSLDRANSSQYKNFGDEINTYLRALNLLVEENILNSIGKHEKSWKAHGLRAIGEWGKMNPASFAAWCRKDGAHATKKYAYRDWNVELLEPVVKDIPKIWKLFEDNIKDCKENCLSALEGMLDGIRDALQAEDGIALLPMNPFLESLAPKKEDLLDQLNRFSTKIKAISNDVKHRAMMEDPDGFLMQAMLPLYDKMKAVRGKGKAQFVQRMTLLRDTMDRGEPFSKIRSGIEAAIKDGLDELRPQLLKGVESVFKGVSDNFDMLFVVKEFPDERRDALRQRLKREVDYARSRIDGELVREFAIATKGPD